MVGGPEPGAAQQLRDHHKRKEPAGPEHPAGSGDGAVGCSRHGMPLLWREDRTRCGDSMPSDLRVHGCLLEGAGIGLIRPSATMTERPEAIWRTPAPGGALARGPRR